jgi:DNA mismatch endonuclease Vsr
MKDKLSTEERSQLMSKVKSKNTTPEMLVFKLLKSEGLKFKRHYKIFGTPDVAFPKLKIAIFVNGEYWHGKNFDKEKHKYNEYWLSKISKNIKRDRLNRKMLRHKGWKIINIWEKRLKKNPESQIKRIIRLLNDSRT